MRQTDGVLQVAHVGDEHDVHWFWELTNLPVPQMHFPSEVKVNVGRHCEHVPEDEHETQFS